MKQNWCSIPEMKYLIMPGPKWHKHPTKLYISIWPTCRYRIIPRHIGDMGIDANVSFGAMGYAKWFANLGARHVTSSTPTPWRSKFAPETFELWSLCAACDSQCQERKNDTKMLLYINRTCFVSYIFHSLSFYTLRFVAPFMYLLTRSSPEKVWCNSHVIYVDWMGTSS